MKKVCVLMGGLSPEREVSLASGEGVFQALTEIDEGIEPVRGVVDESDDLLEALESVDVVFNCLHGGIGENGTIQTLLEILNIDYTGTGPLGSRIGMDKLLTKKICRERNIPVLDYIKYEADDNVDSAEEIMNNIPLPLIGKPCHEGSSIGVKIFRDKVNLRDEIIELRDEYGCVYLERYLKGKEITAGILEIDGEPAPLPLIELSVINEPFYNFKAKYTKGETEFIVPAEIEDPLESEIKEIALETYKGIGCRGFGRVDFRLDQKGQPYVLEVNTLPGMTETSDLPQAASAMGLEYEELVKQMLFSSGFNRPNC